MTTKVQLVSNIVGNVSGGASFTGIVTAPGGVQGIGIYSGGSAVHSGVITALNFVGTGNTFAVHNNRIDISISSGSQATMVIGVRVGTAVTFAIPTTNTLDVVARSGTINVPV